MRRLTRDVLEYCAYGGAVALVSSVGLRWHINATTAALTFLLVVLAAATSSGLVKATVTSLVAVGAFNYYFLPPIRTFTIQDPQNWIAFTVFLITAITASQLSGRAQGKAREARRERLETERLYELSRAILVDESPSRTESMALAHLVRIFKLAQAQFFPDGDELPPGSVGSDWILEAQTQDGPMRRDGWWIVPVQLGGRYAGTLAMQVLHPGQLTDAVAGSIANLLAIGLERRSSFERVAAAEAARRNDELRTALLDGLAHDLKTPLTAIKTSATMLLERQDGFGGAQRELLGIIKEEVDRLQDTVAEALEAGRVESGKFALRPISYSVADLISELMSHRAHYTQRVHLSEIPHDAVIKGDPDLLKLALRQVIENAIRYSPDDEPVEVEIEENEKTISIRVRDSGPGVPEADRPFIFDKFFQGTVGKRVAGGSGLGLAVAKRVIEAHGGSIWLEPGGPGSTFVVRMEREPI